MKSIIILCAVALLQVQGAEIGPQPRRYQSPGHRPSGNKTGGSSGTSPGVPPGSDGVSPNKPPEPLPFEILGYFINTPRVQRGCPPLKHDLMLQIKAQQCADFYQITGEIKKNGDNVTKTCDSFVDMTTEVDMWYVGGCDSGSQAAMIGDWLKEEKDYKYEDPAIANITEFQHFTQLIWKSTTSVACAISKKPIEASEEKKEEKPPSDAEKPNSEAETDQEARSVPGNQDSTRADPPPEGGSGDKGEAGKDEAKDASPQCVHVCMFNEAGNVVVGNRNTMFKQNVPNKK